MSVNIQPSGLVPAKSTPKPKPLAESPTLKELNAQVVRDNVNRTMNLWRDLENARERLGDLTDDWETWDALTHDALLDAYDQLTGTAMQMRRAVYDGASALQVMEEAAIDGERLQAEPSVK